MGIKQKDYFAFQVLPADQAAEGDDSVLDAAKSLLDVTDDSQPSAIDEMLAAGNQDGLLLFMIK